MDWWLSFPHLQITLKEQNSYSLKNVRRTCFSQALKAPQMTLLGCDDVILMVRATGYH